MNDPEPGPESLLPPAASDRARRRCTVRSLIRTLRNTVSSSSATTAAATPMSTTESTALSTGSVWPSENRHQLQSSSRYTSVTQKVRFAMLGKQSNKEKHVL